jgi:hypothetical protein
MVVARDLGHRIPTALVRMRKTASVHTQPAASFPQFTHGQSGACPLDRDRGRCSLAHSRAPSRSAPDAQQRIHSSPPTRCSAARCKSGRARARYYLHSTVARQRATRPRRSVGTTLAWFISAQRVALWEPQPPYAACLGRHVVTYSAVARSHACAPNGPTAPICNVLSPDQAPLRSRRVCKHSLPGWNCVVKNATNATRVHVTAKSLCKVGLTWPC